MPLEPMQLAADRRPVPVDPPRDLGMAEVQMLLMKDANAILLGKRVKDIAARAFRGLSLGKPNLPKPDSDVPYLRPGVASLN